MNRPPPLWPLPCETLFRSPLWEALPPAARGMTVTLLASQWISGRPLPTDARALFMLARGQRPTWARHSADILALIAECQPELARYRQRREAGRTGLQLIQRKGHDGARRKAALASLAEAQPPEPPPLAYAIPVPDIGKRAGAFRPKEPDTPNPRKRWRP